MFEYLESLFGEGFTKNAYATFIARAEASGILDKIDDLLVTVPHADLIADGGQG